MALTNVNDILGDTTDYEKAWLLATVVDNNDPLNTGRFKAEIPELYTEGELPWIGFVKNSPFGVGPGFGVYGSPAIGSVALIRLQEGSPEHPICTGFILLSQHSDPAFKSPHVWGFKDPSGTSLVVDMEADTWTFTHKTGVTLKINAQGEVQVQATKYDFRGHATFHDGVDVHGDIRQDQGSIYTGSVNLTTHHHIGRGNGNPTTEPI